MTESRGGRTGRIACLVVPKRSRRIIPRHRLSHQPRFVNFSKFGLRRKFPQVRFAREYRIPPAKGPCQRGQSSARQCRQPEPIRVLVRITVRPWENGSGNLAHVGPGVKARTNGCRRPHHCFPNGPERNQDLVFPALPRTCPPLGLALRFGNGQGRASISRGNPPGKSKIRTKRRGIGVTRL